MNHLLTATNFAGREDYKKVFDEISKSLLRKYVLKTPRNSYWLREIEFYYYSDNHTDYYCHSNKRQQLNSRFYFHRFKSPETYMNLKRKGIDITFGDGNNCYGGILIRAIQNIETNEIIDGIGKIATLIIEEMGGANEITKLYESNVDVFHNSAKLHLSNSQENNFRIYKKNRQGLNVHSNDVDGYFIKANYNYFTYPEVTELI